MKEDLYDDLLNEKKEEKTDFQALFFKYIIHWPWFVASVLICTGLAFCLSPLPNTCLRSVIFYPN